jgi:S1-C subfamily serine protease
VTLHRSENGEYGFRIHGSRPVVVSAVETNSPAAEQWLEVGDVIMSINGLHVLDSSHSDVVRIASQATSLELELASTRDALQYRGDDDNAQEQQPQDERVLYEGVVIKHNPNGGHVRR